MCLLRLKSAQAYFIQCFVSLKVPDTKKMLFLGSANMYFKRGNVIETAERKNTGSIFCVLEIGSAFISGECC